MGPEKNTLSRWRQLIAEARAAGRLEGIREAVAALPDTIRAMPEATEGLRVYVRDRNKVVAEIRAALTAKLEADEEPKPKFSSIWPGKNDVPPVEEPHARPS